MCYELDEMPQLRVGNVFHSQDLDPYYVTRVTPQYIARSKVVVAYNCS